MAPQEDRRGSDPRVEQGATMRGNRGRCCRRAWGPGRGTRNRAPGPGEGGCAADWWVSAMRGCSRPAGSDALAQRPGGFGKGGLCTGRGGGQQEPRGSASGLTRGGAAQGDAARASSCHPGRVGCHPPTPRPAPDPLRVGLASLSSCARLTEEERESDAPGQRSKERTEMSRPTGSLTQTLLFSSYLSLERPSPFLVLRDRERLQMHPPLPKTAGLGSRPGFSL